MLYIVIHSKVHVLLFLNLEVLIIDGIFKYNWQSLFSLVSKILVYLKINGILDCMDYEINLYYQEGYGYESLYSDNIHRNVETENLH